MSFVPHKACALAIGLQAELGVEAPGIKYLMPLPGGADAMNNRKNYSFFQYSGVQWQRALHETEGEYTEGTLTVPLIPTFLASVDELLHKWLWGRDATPGAYAQSYYATVYRDLGNIVEMYLDVKCTGGTINVDYGAQFASVELNVTGIKAPTEVAWPAVDLTMFAIAPYRYSGAALSLLTAEGAPLGSSSVTRNHSIKWDNKNVSPQDMGVLNGSTFPVALPEEALAEWGGTFDKYFTEADLYRAFLLGSEGQYILTLNQVIGAAAIATFTFPRILYTEDPLKLPDSGLVKEEGIAWEALGSMDGATPACTIEEVG